MLKFSVVLLFLFVFFQKTISIPGELGMKLLNENRKEVSGGSALNVLVNLTNQTDSVKEVKIKLKSNEHDWRLIMDYSAISIENNTSLNKIIGVHIPEKIKSGDYSIELEGIANSDNQTFGKASIPIRIKPRYDIKVEKQNAPQYLFSGDTLSVKFTIYNLSNLDVKVTANVINGNKPEVRYFNIPQDSSVTAIIPVSIPKDLNHYTKQNVTFSASITEKPEIVSLSSYPFDIIPSANLKFDGYNRFPVKISGIAATSNRWGSRNYSGLVDIRGSGIINENKNQKIEFHLRGPDNSGNPILGLNDEYYLTFISPKLEVYLGDRNYNLTDLTEYSRNGRGIKLQYNLSKISFGSFYNIPRYYPGLKQIFSFYTDFKLNQKIQLSAGFLNKTDTSRIKSNLFTLSGILKPLPWLNSSVELTAGQKLGIITKAYKVSLNINKSIFASHFSFTHADPGFPGYISNSMRISSGITANLKKTSFNLNYDLNSSNLALDTLYANAPFSKILNFMTIYRISMNNSVSLGAYSMGIEDKAPNPLFNYNKYFGRIALNSKFRRIVMNVQGEIGKIDNLLGIVSGDMTDFYNGYFSLQYSFNNSFSTRGFVSYQGGQQYQITGFDKFYYGGSLQMNLNKKYFVSIDYQSNYELKDYFRDRNLLSIQMHLQLNPKHELELGTNYNLVKNSLDKKELNIQLRYTYNLNVPISRKKDIGSISGKIINKGTDKVQGIIINLNGNLTITDKNGNFKFPMVKVGKYILAIDESSFGLNAIAEIPGPYHINIESGKETRFELILTKTANIQGKLVIQEDEKVGQKGYLAAKEEIDKVIIEASSGTETFRLFTGRDGTFRFSDLRPGNWHIKVYPNGIPLGFQLVTDQFDIKLDPEKDENLEVIIRKKMRQIKIQNK